jgi:hypothetical protein
VTAPAAWRHTGQVTLPAAANCRECHKDGRHCTTPEPDPASPCGYVGCLTEPGYGPGVRLTPHFVHDLCSGDGSDHGPSCHPHQPTLCLRCHHPIERAP